MLYLSSHWSRVLSPRSWTSRELPVLFMSVDKGYVTTNKKFRRHSCNRVCSNHPKSLSKFKHTGWHGTSLNFLCFSSQDWFSLQVTFRTVLCCCRSNYHNSSLTLAKRQRCSRDERKSLGENTVRISQWLVQSQLSICMDAYFVPLTNTHLIPLVRFYLLIVSSNLRSLCLISTV